MLRGWVSGSPFLFVFYQTTIRPSFNVVPPLVFFDTHKVRGLLFLYVIRCVVLTFLLPFLLLVPRIILLKSFSYLTVVISWALSFFKCPFWVWARAVWPQSSPSCAVVGSAMNARDPLPFCPSVPSLPPKGDPLSFPFRATLPSPSLPIGV